MSFESSTRGILSTGRAALASDAVAIGQHPVGPGSQRLRRMIRTALLGSGSTLTFALLANLHATAGYAADAAAPAADIDTGLTEIIVTAEKRAENLENISAS